MELEEKKSFAFSWDYVSNCISAEIASILRYQIKCEAMIEEHDYWSIRFTECRMHVNDVMRLLAEVQADNDMRSESLPPEGEEDTVRYIGRGLADCLLRRHTGYQWERFISDEEALWVIGCKRNNILNIAGQDICLDLLKSKDELYNYLNESGATHTSLMDYCDEYRRKYHNELCWQYPILEGKHLGTFLVLVKEGILSLPYNDADGIDYEYFTLDDACLLRSSSDMNDFIESWDKFSKDLRDAMQSMLGYLKTTEEQDR